MAENYLEAKSDYRAPLLTGSENYNWWKGRMETYLSKKPLVLRDVQKGNFEFLDKDGKPKNVDDLTPEEVVKFGYNGEARNSLMNALDQAEYDKVSSLKTAKEMWDALETYHEGSKSLRKVKLSKLMNDFGNFKLKDGETIKESQARFQVTINTLKRLGKDIPQDEINMKVLSAVPFIYEPKVTALESSSKIDTVDHLAVFAELEQFESKINNGQDDGVRTFQTKTKNLALHSTSSRPTESTNSKLAESDEESDEEFALITKKIKRLIEKKNRMKREKGGFSNNKKGPKDSKEQTCFECGKPGHYKRDCYRLKSKQPATYRDKKKSKALLTWSDDDSDSSDDSSEDMVNLALVGLNDEDTSQSLEDSDNSESEDDISEVNSIKSDFQSTPTMQKELTK